MSKYRASMYVTIVYEVEFDSDNMANAKEVASDILDDLADDCATGDTKRGKVVDVHHSFSGCKVDHVWMMEEGAIDE